MKIAKKTFLFSGLILSLFFLKYVITNKFGYILTSNIVIPYHISILLILLTGLLLTFFVKKKCLSSQLLFSFFFNVPNFQGFPFIFSLGEFWAQTSLSSKFLLTIKNIREAFNGFYKFRYSKHILFFLIYLSLVLILQMFVFKTINFWDLKIVLQALFALFSLIYFIYLIHDSINEIDFSFVLNVLIVVSIFCYIAIYFDNLIVWSNNTVYGGWYFDRFKSIFMDPSHLAFFLLAVWLLSVHNKKLNLKDILINYMVFYVVIASGSRGGLVLLLLATLGMVILKKINFNILLPIFVLSFQIYFMFGVYLPAQLNPRDFCGKGGVLFGEKVSLVYNKVGGHALCKSEKNMNLNISFLDLLERTRPGSDRIKLIKSSFVDLKKSNFMGYGLGLDSHKTQIKESAHSVLLSILIELGVPGAIVFIYYCKKIFIDIIRKKKYQELIVFCFLMIGANIYPVYKFASFWVLCCVLISRIYRKAFNV